MLKFSKILFLLLTFSIFACSKSDDAAPTPDDSSNGVVEENSDMQVEIALQLNRLRTEGCTCAGNNITGLDSLKRNDKLAEAALRHANDMNDNQFLSHRGSDASDVAQRIAETGYTSSLLAENVAKDYTTVTEVVNFWISDNDYCENIMNADFTEYGLARAGNYWVLVLAKPSNDTSGGGSGGGTGGGSGGGTSAFAQEMLDAVNAIRATGCNCGSTYKPPVPALTWDSRLEAASLRHSTDMSDNDHFSHTGTDGSKHWERISDAGYNWSRTGENIAWGQPTIEAVVQAWKDSEGHCENMMNGNFTQMGASKVGIYWTQKFAKPQ